MKCADNNIYISIPIKSLVKIFRKFDSRFSEYENHVINLGTSDSISIQAINHNEVVEAVSQKFSIESGLFDVSYTFLKKRSYQRNLNRWVKMTILTTLGNFPDTKISYHGLTESGARVSVNSEVKLECDSEIDYIKIRVKNPTHILNHWFKLGLIPMNFPCDSIVTGKVFGKILFNYLEKLIDNNEFVYESADMDEVSINIETLIRLLENNGEKIAI